MLNCNMDKNELLKIVALVYGVTVEDIKTKSRKRQLVDARKLFCLLVTTLIKWQSYIGYTTTTKTGEAIGVTHSSVLYFIKDAQHQKRYNSNFREAHSRALGMIHKRISESDAIRNETTKIIKETIQAIGGKDADGCTVLNDVQLLMVAKKINTLMQ